MKFQMTSEGPPGVWEASIPVGYSDFSLSYARVMLISSLFTFHYISLATHAQAQAQAQMQVKTKFDANKT